PRGRARGLAVAETKSSQWNVALRPFHHTATREIDRHRKAARTSAIAKMSKAFAGSRDPLPGQECATEKESTEADRAAICSMVAPAAWAPEAAEHQPLQTTWHAGDRSKDHAQAHAPE